MAVSEEESSSANGNNSRSPVAHGVTHYIAKRVLKGSAVLQVVYGHIRSASSLDIVFGKETSLELVKVDDHGVVLSICDQPIFGIIKDIAILPWNNRFRRAIPQLQGKDLLLVTSDSGDLSVLSFHNGMHRFFALCHIPVSSSSGNLRHQIGRKLTVDSNGCFIASSAYEDHLVLFKVTSSTSADIIDKKIFFPSDNEKDTSTSMGVSGIHGTIWSMCFISKDTSQLSEEHDPLLAILLNRKGSLLNELLLLEWNTKDNFVHVLSQYAELGPLALDIVEVPYSYGYAFLFRVSDALLMDLRDPHNPLCVYRTSLNFLPSILDDHNYIEESYRINDVDEEGNICNVAASALLELKDIVKDDDPMNIDDDNGYSSKSTSNRVCSWCWEPGNFVNPRMIFCVDTGELYMIEIYSESNGLKVNLSDCLYKGLTFKELLWTENGFLTAVAEMGDGMVLEFEDGKLNCKSPIQNISPILDMSLVDYHDEKHEQIFACCGMAPEGSLRVIRNGVSLEKLLKTAPDYQGITGTWTVKMKLTDCYHSFLVLSFVEETRVLSVGVSFTDVTDSVGFQPDVCTLACGVISDGLLVQIHQNAVRLALPTTLAHPDGIPFQSPSYTSWSPNNTGISLGAIGNNLIVVATSNPCYLFVLGVRQLADYQYEVYQMQNVGLEYELSCISIPQKPIEEDLSNYHVNYSNIDPTHAVKAGNTFVIGTHRPSVEVISFEPGHGIKALAVGVISLVNSIGTTISGSIPQDVRLVKVDQLYIVSGLRNGMLLRFEWPLPDDTSVNSARSSIVSEVANEGGPVNLELISIRRIGITPAFLIPLNDLLDADIIALSDRPWLLQTARHTLSLNSISFQASTHATPVCTSECPNGILFVSENSLHLLEMIHNRRLNVQKFHIGGTPRKILYHVESRLLLVLRTHLSDDSCSSDICCVDPMSGSVLSSFKLDLGETGKCMELLKVGSEQVLVVGTSLSSGPAIMPSGEAESTKGRLIVLCLEHKQNSDSGSMTFYSKGGSSSQRTSPFREISGYGTDSLCSSPDDNSCDETEAWNFRLAYSTNMRGNVLAICSYLDCYFLASAGNAFYVCSFQNDNSLRVKRLAVGRTRFTIMTLTTHFTTIAVGDCRDGVLFYAYNEDSKKVEQLYSDPMQRLVADCHLINIDTAIVSDRMGGIAVVSGSHHSGDNASPECNLKVFSSIYMGEIVMNIKKGSFSHKLLADDEMRACDIASSIMDLSKNNSIVASTLLGSIIVFIPISRDEYELLKDVQSRIAGHPLTSPILDNSHDEFRSRQSPAGAEKILDGDMLGQFLELTNAEQEDILAVPEDPLAKYRTRSLRKSQLKQLNVSKVVRLLERVYCAID